MSTTRKEYERWLSSPRVSASDKTLLRSYNDEQIANAFFKNVEFGTAGMRGIIGPGTNRLNLFTVRKSTVAFGLALLEAFPDARQRGVAISHDNRYLSRELTLDTAETLNRMGINTFIFDQLRPTPVLSFAVRYSHCVGGVMMTASHNPKEYNGYKVYDENGCQLVPEKLDRILKKLEELPNYLELEIPEAEVRGTNTIYDHKIDDEYIRLVEAIQLRPELSKDKFKIVFSPQHGTAAIPAMRIFNDLGYHVYPVEAQMNADTRFSNTLSPNPEDQRAYIEPIKLAEKVKADLVFITDPDADRVGLAYLNEDGGYTTMSGNQSGSVLLYYILSTRKEKGLLAKHGAMYSTIVTSNFAAVIAESFGVEVKRFLTGFKYIGDAIEKALHNNGPEYEFGFEESYGCLIAPFVRDKDALQALVLYLEAANYYLQQGKSFGDVYEELQQIYGYHNDVIKTIDFDGAVGAEKLRRMLDSLRAQPLTEIGGFKVIQIDDFLVSKSYRLDEVVGIDLPTADVLRYTLENGATVIIRPSGTEPKCKFYFGVRAKTKAEVVKMPALLHESLLSKLVL